MLVTKQPVLKQFWYPVLPIAHLLPSKPQPFELLGQRIVLWMDEDGKPAAVVDRCCHRSAQLSKGVVVEGNIRCPYHGWCFNAEGVVFRFPNCNPGQFLRPTECRRTIAPNAMTTFGSVWENPSSQFQTFQNLRIPNFA